MKRIEMKRNFRNKNGYTLIVMYELPIEYSNGKSIHYKMSYCYPAVQDDKEIEYVQDVCDMTRDEANAEYLKLKKKGFEVSNVRR